MSSLKLRTYQQGDGQRFLCLNTSLKEGTMEPYGIPSGDPALDIPGSPVTSVPIPVNTPIQGQVLPYPGPVVGPEPMVPTKSTTYSDPAIELDYYSIDCKTLYLLISSTQNTMLHIRNEAAYEYYTQKVQEMQEVYYKRDCRVGQDVVDPVIPTSDPGMVTPPVVSIDPIIGTTVVSGGSTDTPLTSAAPATGTSGGGGGGGGGGSSAPAPAAKPKKPDFKKDWFWWLAAAAVVGFAIYQGRNTKLKMPGK